MTLAQKVAVKRSMIALVVMIIGSIAIDQKTKIDAEASLMTYSHETNLKQYAGKKYPLFSMGKFIPEEGSIPFYLEFNFNYVRNQGAAWGVLSDVRDSIRVPFFHMVTFLAVVVIFVFFKQTPVSHRLARFALGLILSGAFGNFIDRIRIGYVIDWIDVRWNLFGWRYNFPNFNFADACISVGVAFLMIDMLFLESKRKREAESETAQDTGESSPVEA